MLATTVVIPRKRQAPSNKTRKHPTWGARVFPWLLLSPIQERLYAWYLPNFWTWKNSRRSFVTILSTPTFQPTYQRNGLRVVLKVLKLIIPHQNLSPLVSYEIFLTTIHRRVLITCFVSSSMSSYIPDVHDVPKATTTTPGHCVWCASGQLVLWPFWSCQFFQGSHQLAHRKAAQRRGLSVRRCYRRHLQSNACSCKCKFSAFNWGFSMTILHIFMESELSRKVNRSV